MTPRRAKNPTFAVFLSLQSRLKNSPKPFLKGYPFRIKSTYANGSRDAYCHAPTTCLRHCVHDIASYGMARSYPDFQGIECVTYTEDFLPQELASYDLLLEELEPHFYSDEESRVLVFGQWRNIPRRQFAMGDDGLTYRYSGNTVPAMPWDTCPTVRAIRDHIRRTLGVPVSFVLVNYYADGTRHIGWHSDDEKDLDPEQPIVSLSFGELRAFRLRSRDAQRETYQQVLAHNSCVQMHPPCQSLYQHSVPASARVHGGRINLTFRVMRT